MKAYRAHHKRVQVTGSTPRAAAQRLFRAYPALPKCSIYEGHMQDGQFIPSPTPSGWVAVTPSNANQLPEN